VAPFLQNGMKCADKGGYLIADTKRRQSNHGRTLTLSAP
jgi:hypothetical protein